MSEWIRYDSKDFLDDVAELKKIIREKFGKQDVRKMMTMVLHLGQEFIIEFDRVEEGLGPELVDQFYRQVLGNIALDRGTRGK